MARNVTPLSCKAGTPAHQWLSASHFFFDKSPCYDAIWQGCSLVKLHVSDQVGIEQFPQDQFQLVWGQVISFHQEDVTHTLKHISRNCFSVNGSLGHVKPPDRQVCLLYHIVRTKGNATSSKKNWGFNCRDIIGAALSPAFVPLCARLLIGVYIYFWILHYGKFVASALLCFVRSQGRSS